MTTGGEHGNGGAIGARVENLEQSVAAIRSDIASLSQLVVASQKTPWSTLISAAGVIIIITTGFSQLSLQPIRDATARNGDDVKLIQNAIVPRGEHEERWRAQDQAIAGQQRQIDEIRQDLGSTYSLKDALTHMQSDIDKLKDGKEATH